MADPAPSPAVLLEGKREALAQARAALTEASKKRLDLFFKVQQGEFRMREAVTAEAAKVQAAEAERAELDGTGLLTEQERAEFIRDADATLAAAREARDKVERDHAAALEPLVKARAEAEREEVRARAAVAIWERAVARAEGKA